MTFKVDQWGHFKCLTEKKSDLVKISFAVKDDLEEFFRNHSDGDDDNVSQSNAL